MHKGLTPLLAAAGLALTGCGAQPPPEVTFYSDGQSVEVVPARYCEEDGTQCVPPPKNPVGQLTVPKAEPLQISVPGEVASTPWQVAFIYRDANGKEQDGRSSVFPPDERFAYTLELPADGVRLEHVEVQQFSAVLLPGSDGGVDFGIAGSWVLDTR